VRDSPKPEGARALLEQAAEFGETAEILDGLGEALQFGGEHSHAIELKERAVAEYQRRGLRAEAAELLWFDDPESVVAEIERFLAAQPRR
jgi:hypothetical protein